MSPVDAIVYHGFMEGKGTKRGCVGWFPEKIMQIVEDPAKSAEEEVHLGPLPLPRVPQALLQQRSVQ